VVRSDKQSGFTLVELMVTVSIIAIAMAVTLPSLRQSLRDRKLQQHAIDFINTFRQARSRAMLRGRAHLVVVHAESRGGASTVTLIEGNTSSCTLSDFTTAPSRTVYVQDSILHDDEVQVVPVSPANTPDPSFCFTPSGRTLFRPTPNDDLTESPGSFGGGFIFAFSNIRVPATVTRRVFIPLNGIPRLVL